MAWTHEYNSTLRLVEVVFTGDTTGRDLHEATTKAISLSKERGITRFLVDAAELKLSAPLIDIIDLPDKQYVEEGLDRRSRVALITPISPRGKEAAQFYETVCYNRGWQVQLFTTRDEAMAWLHAAEGSKKTG